jgi:tellurite methyltransferase
MFSCPGFCDRHVSRRSDTLGWEVRGERRARTARSRWLVEQVAPLRPGRALELACGLGHNATWLARRGWDVDAVDISPEGLRIAESLASAHSATVHWIAADLDEFIPARGSYDLVCVFRFLDRVHLPRRISEALADGGRLVYETFTVSHLTHPKGHIKNRDFLLERGELPRLFSSLRPVAYAECELPDRSVARLTAVRDLVS